MQRMNRHPHAGRWRAEFERPDQINTSNTNISDENIAEMFRFFNEIGIIGQLSQNLFESVMPDGLTQSQFGVLNHFVRLGRIESPARLASAFQVTKGAMTNTLGRLEKRSFVSIVPDPNDGRAKLVDITDGGRQAHSDCITALVPMLKKLGAAMDIEGFSSAIPQLEKVRNYLDKARE